MGQPSVRNLTNFSSTGVKSALQALHAEHHAVLTQLCGQCRSKSGRVLWLAVT